MPGSWKKFLLAGDVVAPAISAADPQPVDGTAAAAGSTGDVSDAGHVHLLGPLIADLDFDQNSPLSLVLENSSAGPDAAAEVGGEVYYDTDDDHPYVWVP